MIIMDNVWLRLKRSKSHLTISLKRQTGEQNSNILEVLYNKLAC